MSRIRIGRSYIKRSRNKDLGKAGETMAYRYLKGCGYNVLERNYSTPLGEIDIVAKDGSVLVFVEVKTRRSTIYGMPEESVDIKKKRKLTKLAQLYISKKRLFDKEARFDIVSICVDGPFGDNKIRLIKNAFYAEE